MEHNFDPEAIDLATLRTVLQARCGAFLDGEIVGRTSLRDEVARRLTCSLLEAELVVDTMITRGFLRLHKTEDGRTGWRVSVD